MSLREPPLLVDIRVVSDVLRRRTCQAAFQGSPRASTFVPLARVFGGQHPAGATRVLKVTLTEVRTIQRIIAYSSAPPLASRCAVGRDVLRSDSVSFDTDS